MFVHDLKNRTLSLTPNSFDHSLNHLDQAYLQSAIEYLQQTMSEKMHFANFLQNIISRFSRKSYLQNHGKKLFWSSTLLFIGLKASFLDTVYRCGMGNHSFILSDRAETFTTGGQDTSPEVFFVFNFEPSVKTHNDFRVKKNEISGKRFCSFTIKTDG